MSTVATVPAEAAEVQTSNPQAIREERIRIRAYEFFVARDGKSGDADGDWFHAEAEIEAEPAEAAK